MSGTLRGQRIKTGYAVGSRRCSKLSPSSLLKNPGFGFSLMIHFGYESVEAQCAGDFGTKVDCFPPTSTR
jgi:hypothetical protein